MSKRDILNAALQRNGFEPLANPRALLDQLAALVKDHDDFQRLLWKTESAERPNAYWALKPRLRFQAKPLEDYLSASREWASAAYSRSAAGKPLEARAQAAVENAGALGVLTVQCCRCKGKERFRGKTMVDAIARARAAGWVYLPASEEEICQTCQTHEAN